MAMRAAVMPEDSVQLAASISNISNHYKYNDAVGGAEAMYNEVSTSFNPAIRGGRPHMAQLRKVKQFLVDPTADDSLELKQRILYEGPEFWTDETDQELQHRVPVMDHLVKHNDLRKTVVDKTHRGDKDRFLEPVKLRHLRLTTVTIFSV